MGRHGNRRGRYWWVAGVVSIVSALLFASGALLQMGVVVISEPVSFSSEAQAALSTQPPSAHLSQSLLPPGVSIPNPTGTVCSWVEANPAVEIIPVLLPFGPACELDLENQIAHLNQVNAAVAVTNLGLTTYDFLNQTAALTADINATFQELLSYYESRAEAIVPYFLNATWNTTTEDQLLVSSGLVPSLEGLEYAFGEQEFQDWNATAAEWNAAFGSSGILNPTQAVVAYGNLRPNTNLISFAGDGTSIGVTPPWEYWAPQNPLLNQPFYFNLMPGGTIVSANYFNSSLGVAEFARYQATDLTNGATFTVPYVNYTDWTNQSVPIVSTADHISQFDLLKLTCLAFCNKNPTVEALGGYAFQNYTQYTRASGFVNTMVPQLFLKPIKANASFYPVPSPGKSVCFSYQANGSGPGPCNSAIIPVGGNATMLSSGPGQVIGGNGTPYGFPATAQSLINNTAIMAHDYWLTLRAITDKGAYPIPATCSIPPPSDAFPVSTNFQNYNLSANNVEGVYLAYLSSIYSLHNISPTNVIGFCNDPDLGMAFNWTGSWNLLLNITASIYVANETTPLYLNGTADPAATYSNSASWPVYHIDPALLYPTEYQMNVPLNTVYPVPANDPVVGVLVNYTGNLFYGQNTNFSPKWGLPTYVSLGGHGDYIYVSGNLSNVSSGTSNSTGDAIAIKSCILLGLFHLNPCPISVTYFDNFTIGLVHAVYSPAALLPGALGGLGALGNSCGFSALNQFYDGWAGYVGSVVADVFAYFGNAVGKIPIIGGGLSYIINGIGCILAWIVVILLFALFAYVAVKVFASIYHSAKSNRRAKSENVS
jgi:hypothetical protein